MNELHLCPLSAENFDYLIQEDGTAEITRYKGDSDKLVIPAELDGHTVTKIARLKSPEAGNGPMITAVVIPDSVQVIEDNPFKDCADLSSVIVSPEHPYLEVKDGVLFSRAEKRLICYPHSLKAGTYEIPGGTQIIGVSAFSQNSSLTGIVIPDSVKEIGAYAFSFCINLTEIRIPRGISRIATGTFAFCGQLNSLCLPDGVETIEDGAFNFCSSLTNIRIPDTVTAIGKMLFCPCDPAVTAAQSSTT